MLLSAAMCGVAYAAPFLAMGDNAELFLTGTASVKYDDNIYLSTNGAKSDTIFTAAPGFDLVYGKGSATTGNLYYHEDFVKYSSNSEQDTALSNVGLNTKYDDGGKSTFAFGGSYAQLAQNTVDARAEGDIVRREVTKLDGLSEFGLTEKTSLGVGAAYNDTRYKKAGYANLKTWSVPVDVYSQYSEKLAMSVGYRYSDNQVGNGGIDSKDHFFNIGARGEFTPMLDGQVRFGYTKRKFDAGSDQSLFGMEGNLTYKATEKTSCQLNFSNAFNNAGTGDSTKNLTLGVAANSKLTEQWGVNVGLNYQGIKYPTRRDDFWVAQLGVNYAYNAYVNFNAGYNYTKNQSDNNAAEFADNVLMIGANIRY